MFHYMSNNPLRNLGSDNIIKFLLANDCKQGATHGDDTIFYYPGNYDVGVSVRINKKVKKSGYSLATLYNMIHWLEKASNSHITKATWIEWFSKK